MIKEKNKMKKNNILLVLGLFLLGIVLFAIITVVSNKGSNVEVIVNGNVEKTFSLDKDKQITLENKYGYNVLKIKNGEASITEANCKDKLCTQQRKISKDGETIVCLPHKTVIKVNSIEKSKIDGVSQ